MMLLWLVGLTRREEPSAKLTLHAGCTHFMYAYGLSAQR
jgi:hypothetical protein